MMMNMIVKACLAVGLALLTHAAPSTSPPCHLKESVPLPRAWIQSHRAPADHIIPLRIALPQHNFHLLEAALYEVSDPAHPRYGAHLSKEEVHALIEPSAEARAVEGERRDTDDEHVFEFAAAVSFYLCQGRTSRSHRYDPECDPYSDRSSWSECGRNVSAQSPSYWPHISSAPGCDLLRDPRHDREFELEKGSEVNPRW